LAITFELLRLTLRQRNRLRIPPPAPM